MERENGAASHVIRVINESALLIWGLPCLFWKKVWWSAVKRILFATHQHKQHRRQFHPLWPTTMLICLLILHFIQIGLIALSLLFDGERRTATHSSTIYTILVVYIFCPHNWWIPDWRKCCVNIYLGETWIQILMYKHISCTCTMWSHFIRCLFSLSTTWHLPQKRKENDQTGYLFVPCLWSVLSYLQVSQYRMFFDAWEEDPHGVCPVVQERDSCTIQITGQLMDVCLELCKSWWIKQTGGGMREGHAYWNHSYSNISKVTDEKLWPTIMALKMLVDIGCSWLNKINT